MRIQVRKCPFTGEIFEEKDKEKYIKHLREVRKNLRSERKNTCMRNTWKKWLSEQKRQITHVDQIPSWFLKNQHHIMNACNAIEFTGSRESDRFVEEDKFTELKWEDVKFEKICSNSHVCPDRGVTNWCGREKGRPLGYPGFRGSLNGKLVRPAKKDSWYPYTNALNLVGIKTGSGGGGNKGFRYGFTVFVEDWPGLKEQVKNMERDQIVSILMGQ